MTIVGLIDSIRTWGRMVKFSHSVFALPFAFAGAILAGATHPITGGRLFWITVAMVGARNAAMGFNRLVDEGFDAANPRTSNRELPRGLVTRSAVWGLTAASTALFILAALRLGLLWFAAPVVAVIFFYSYTKRFTWSSHFVLGFALGLAPIGGWLAVAGSLEAVGCLLGAAVMAWVAGFDIVYACQDVEFDRGAGLHSIPARFGTTYALVAARVLHAVTLVLLAAVGVAHGVRPIYWAGWAAILLLLVHQHRLVRSDDLTRVGAAFFNSNATVSMAYLVTVLVAAFG